MREIEIDSQLSSAYILGELGDHLNSDYYDDQTDMEE